MVDGCVENYGVGDKFSNNGFTSTHKIVNVDVKELNHNGEAIDCLYTVEEIDTGHRLNVSGLEIQKWLVRIYQLGVIVVKCIDEMTNDELVNEYERIINRIQRYRASGEYGYKDRLRSAILERMIADVKNI